MTINLKTIDVVAADMGKTLSFYRTLGLPIPDRLDGELNVDFEAPNGIVLGFLSEKIAKQADPNYQTPVGQNLNLQFMVDTAEDLDEISNRIVNAGYESYAEPWDAFWGQRFGKVKDPINRIVNIYANL